MPKGIYPRTEEHNRKISEAQKGEKGNNWGLHPSEETRRKMSEASKGNKYNLGNKASKETRKKMSDIAKKNENGKRLPHEKGENSPLWKGGITPINNKIRGSLEYKLWQDSVFNRDCNHCQKCGECRVSKLVGHHILNFSSHIDLRFAIDNGITLCRDCHRIFHKKYGKKNNTKGQLEEFFNIK